MNVRVTKFTMKAGGSALVRVGNALSWFINDEVKFMAAASVGLHANWPVTGDVLLDLARLLGKGWARSTRLSSYMVLSGMS